MVQQDASKGPGDGTVVQLKNWRHMGQQLGLYGAATVAQAAAIANDLGAIVSNSFAIDSTGLRTLTMAHGFSGTVPLINEVQLTVNEVDDVDDWAYDLLKVVSVDGTNIVARINVSTASLTANASAKLGVTFSQFVINRIVTALRDLGIIAT